jgi:hypothetical protein
MQRSLLSLIAAVGLGLVGSQGVEAGPISAAAFSSPTVLDFDDYVGQTITTQYSSLGATFSGFNFVTAPNPAAFLMTAGITVSFSVPVNRVGFDLIDNVSTTPVVLEVYGASGLLGTVSSMDPNAFLGFQSSENITHIAIHDSGGTFRIDNLRFEAGIGAVAPEPAALLLLATGLASLGVGSRFARRRKKPQ